MNYPDCQKCGSGEVATERRPNGDRKCLKCGHKWPASDDSVKTLRAEVARLTKMLDVCSDVHGHNVKLKAERDQLRERVAALEDNHRAFCALVGTYDYAEGQGYVYGTHAEVMRAVELLIHGKAEAKAELDQLRARVAELEARLEVVASKMGEAISKLAADSTRAAIEAARKDE